MNYDVRTFSGLCHFPEEACASLLEAENRLFRCGQAQTVFLSCREQLFAEDGDPWPALDVLAWEVDVHPMQVHQLFLIFCAGRTHQLYRDAGLSDALLWDAMRDLKVKMEITHRMYGVWGTYCGPWLAGLLRMQCFCLGRLQFELLSSPVSMTVAGHTLRLGEPVINIHIPSFGKLLYADVLDAYTRAAAFFAPSFPDGAVWFHCETWILYPPVNALLPEGNMRRFSADFRLAEAYIDPKQDDRFRVFERPPEEPVSSYPETNQLQRRLKQWLLAENTMGVGVGCFLWKNGEVVADDT